MTNFNRLVAYKMSLDAVPKGGGVVDAIKFLTTPGAVSQGAKAATEWVREAIALVRNAAEPNPWKDASEETIAGEILKGINARLASVRSPR